MNKNLSRVLILLLVAVTFCGCGKKYKSVSEFYEYLTKNSPIQSNLSYTMLISAPNANLKNIVFVKGDKMRTETSTDSITQKQASITILDNETVYTYMPEMNVAIKTKNPVQKNPDPLKWNEHDLAAFTLGEKTTHNELACQTIFDKDNNEFCISDKYNMLIYSKVTSGKDEVITNITDIKTDEIDDTIFTIPSYVRILGI